MEQLDDLLASLSDEILDRQPSAPQPKPATPSS
jgi:hypothetical protein